MSYLAADQSTAFLHHRTVGVHDDVITVILLVFVFFIRQFYRVRSRVRIRVRVRINCGFGRENVWLGW